MARFCQSGSHEAKVRSTNFQVVRVAIHVLRAQRLFLYKKACKTMQCGELDCELWLMLHIKNCGMCHGQRAYKAFSINSGTHLAALAMQGQHAGSCMSCILLSVGTAQ